MKYTVAINKINVLGYIWMPHALCAQVLKPTAYDRENMRDDAGKITRESVQRWLDTNAGDFSHIVDFAVSLDEELESDFTSEENEMAWRDAMYGSEE